MPKMNATFSRATATYLAADVNKGVSCSDNTMRLNDMKLFKKKRSERGEEQPLSSGLRFYAGSLFHHDH